MRDQCGILCPDCYRKEVEAIRDFYAADRKKKLTSAIVCTILYIVGFVFLALASINMIFILVGILLIGGYCAISAWRFASNSIDDYDAKHGATYVITDTGISRDRSTWLKIVFFIFGLAFGIFVTPVCVIRWLIQANKSKKHMESCEGELAAL